KGVDIVLAAAAQVDETTLALVGGPTETAMALREEWLEHGQPAERFLLVDQVPPEEIPLYLRAFDVCTMPLPWTEHFAYYASPLKLFEYMAAGGAIVASDLPSWEDVLQHEVNALLVPPSDIEAMRAALQRLHDEPALREQLGAAAQQCAFNHYTWEARARAILEHIRHIGGLAS
ncbi:MAG: glycosyltransferase, partial [Chloroflexi bacterium]